MSNELKNYCIIATQDGDFSTIHGPRGCITYTGMSSHEDAQRLVDELNKLDALVENLQNPERPFDPDAPKTLLYGTGSGQYLSVLLDCNRKLEFNVGGIPLDSDKQWTGETLRDIVNEIILAERHKAVEEYKNKLREMQEPMSFPAFREIEREKLAKTRAERNAKKMSKPDR